MRRLGVRSRRASGVPSRRDAGRACAEVESSTGASAVAGCRADGRRHHRRDHRDRSGPRLGSGGDRVRALDGHPPDARRPGRRAAVGHDHDTEAGHGAPGPRRPHLLRSRRRGAGHPRPVRPAAGAQRRRVGARRRPGRHHLLPGGDQPGRVVGSGGAVRAGGIAGCGIGDQGHQHPAGTRRQHRPRADGRPHERAIRRGPVPERPDRRRLHPRRAVPARDRHGQALRRQQPGGQPFRGQREGVRPGPPRDLPTAVRRRHRTGRRRCGDVRLQPGQRRLRLPEPEDHPHRPQRPVRLPWIRHVGLGRDPLHGRLGAGRPRHGDGCRADA